MIDIFISAGTVLLNTFLVFNVLFLLFFSVAGHLPVRKKPAGATRQRRICVLVPAYKADDVVLQTALLMRRHQYSGSFTVFVIADGLLAATRQALRQAGVTVIEVAFQNSTKGKALAAAMSQIDEDLFDLALVLDVDNEMGSGFLEKVNEAFDAGYDVVQGHRVAKNLQASPFSFLDACNEEINNHIFRKGHFALGIPPALIGSGMAFHFRHFKQLLQNVGDTVGEDKELELRINRDCLPICYLDHAYIYDEKVENAHVFTNQRTRWIATQLEFLKKYVRTLTSYRGAFRPAFLLKTVECLVLPRILLTGMLGLLFLIAAVIPEHKFLQLWGTLLLLLTLALLLALPRRLYNGKMLRAVLNLPVAFYCMVKALFKLNRVKSSFLATPHSTLHSTDYKE